MPFDKMPALILAAVQDGSEDYKAVSVDSTRCGSGGSCAVVERFLGLSIDGKSMYDSGVDVESNIDSRPSPWIQEMRKASQRKTRLVSLNPATRSVEKSLRYLKGDALSSRRYVTTYKQPAQWHLLR